MVQNTVPPPARPNRPYRESIQWFLVHRLCANSFGLVNFTKWSIKGTVVSFPWPAKDPCDPNHFWRPWLEANVGRQGWSWNWRAGGHTLETVEIKFRRSEDAMLFSLIQDTL